MQTAIIAQWFLFYSCIFLFSILSILNICDFCKENIYTFVKTKAQKPRAFWFFFNVLRNNHTRIDDFYFFIYTFLHFTNFQQ